MRLSRIIFFSLIILTIFGCISLDVENKVNEHKTSSSTDINSSLLDNNSFGSTEKNTLNPVDNIITRDELTVEADSKNTLPSGIFCENDLNQKKLFFRTVSIMKDIGFSYSETWVKLDVNQFSYRNVTLNEELVNWAMQTWDADMEHSAITIQLGKGKFISSDKKNEAILTEEYSMWKNYEPDNSDEEILRCDPKFSSESTGLANAIIEGDPTYALSLPLICGNIVVSDYILSFSNELINSSNLISLDNNLTCGMTNLSIGLGNTPNTFDCISKQECLTHFIYRTDGDYISYIFEFKNDFEDELLVAPDYCFSENHNYYKGFSAEQELMWGLDWSAIKERYLIAKEKYKSTLKNMPQDIFSRTVLK